ncbi:inositol 1,4,5-triphosphate receptor associated 1 [Protopterus annectens]|uniref:inositol 1,4,5-triphosphate receptor associated 1 n=1 Tax=Protopterus annectens TaxID=7888 RepID=UPI001CFBE9CD|nr:inositol 1,4,5-triphosphate receptor associated 1 [Protopterus annectens]
MKSSNTPSIVLPDAANTSDRDATLLAQNRPRSPRPSLRHSRTSKSSLTTVDSEGHVLDLVNDELPDCKISDIDKKKNLELLEEAKKASERFLTRRGRRSRNSLTESSTAFSPTPSPGVSPASSRSNSLIILPQTGTNGTIVNSISSAPLFQHLEVPAARDKKSSSDTEVEKLRKELITQSNNDHRNSSPAMSTLQPAFLNLETRLSEQKENMDPCKFSSDLSETSKTEISAVSQTNTVKCTGESKQTATFKTADECSLPMGDQLQGCFSPVDLSPKTSPVHFDTSSTFKPELRGNVARPPLVRAASFDSVGPGKLQTTAVSQGLIYDNLPFNEKDNNLIFKSTGYKDFPVQPQRVQKLTKLWEEHKQMRTQNLLGMKLPELNESAENEKGAMPNGSSINEDDPLSYGEVMPNIPDSLLQSLRVHKKMSSSSPALTEKEVENVFVQLSLAFRNDSYTLETRLRLAERERNCTEENIEKELDDFKTVAMEKSLFSLWQHPEEREAYQKLQDTIAVLCRLTTRLSSRAEMVGAVRQEQRMSKATEIMMQYVENLKRTYEKDHAELTEFKKLANQNTSRHYGGSDDGVPRVSRSMSLSMGKAMPRRRVSVAVVPKFNLLTIPGQNPNALSLSSLSALPETANEKCSTIPCVGVPPFIEHSLREDSIQDTDSPALCQGNQPEVKLPKKAKSLEEAYNKGYQEGLKQSNESADLKDDEKLKTERNINWPGETDKGVVKNLSKFDELLELVSALCPKLHKDWNIIWIVAAVLVVFAFVFGIYSSVSDTSHGKSSCSTNQQHSWWTSALQQK